MGLPMSVEKVEDTPDHCVYTFGTPDAVIGRVRLHKSSGDVELIQLDGGGDVPNEQFYLAHLVPRLQDYHDRDAYPDTERWEA